jgi:site-specific DNA-methyltransferase (adenine-specific)
VTVETGPGWELRLGDYRDVLADVTCDALVTDPPYSDVTHVGMRVGDALTGSGNPYTRKGVAYDRWSDEDMRAFVREWSSRVHGWVALVEDHVLARVALDECKTQGRYSFAPVPFVEMGKQPRLTGDGPASWTCWLAVARPKSKEWLVARKAARDAREAPASLPGAYVLEGGQGHQADREIKGGKPLWLMRAIVRDYSEPGDLICDPCAGGGTTLLAAVIEGRRAIGAERDPDTFAKAVTRLRRGYTPTFDFGAP